MPTESDLINSNQAVTAKYTPHNGGKNDSSFDVAFYEVIYQHELGHASYFFDYTLKEFYQGCLNIISDFSIESVSDAGYFRGYFTAFLDTLCRDHTPESGQRANHYTRAYFENSAHWKTISQNIWCTRMVEE